MAKDDAPNIRERLVVLENRFAGRNQLEKILAPGEINYFTALIVVPAAKATAASAVSSSALL